MDWYFAVITTLVVGIAECTMVSWIYGPDRILRDFQLMLGKKPPYVFIILWRFVTPVTLTVVLIFTLLTYKPPKIEDFEYSKPLQGFGWCVALTSFVPIPLWATYKLITAQGTLTERLTSTCTPSSQWKPADQSLREKYAMETKHETPCNVRLPCSRV
ncbi:sodium- and chloride-dependent glycine transporter 1 [Aplysia californica]|uniref:Sodium- and chloride-dependent glycine transporter 1 n=1 Tax=Aplysia californica TaxID=6500 RepID=A0ABM1A1F2_APLCA|nr:sodium- and chloride-dependent glycine transporter 1 [Aplysia californica]